MARFNLFDAGYTSKYPWNPDAQPQINQNEVLRYAAHVPVRHKVLEHHVDLTDDLLAGFLERNTRDGKGLIDNDELVLFALGAGTVIEHFVVQVKGLFPPAQAAGAGNTNPSPRTPPTWEFRIEDMAGNILHTFDPITMDATGYTPNIDVNVFVPTNGYLVARLVRGEAVGGCFGALVSLVQLYDERDCGCAAVACETEYPEPGCNPFQSGYGSGAAGVGLAAAQPPASNPPGGGGSNPSGGDRSET